MTTSHATPDRVRRPRRLSRWLGVAAATLGLAATGLTLTATPAAAATVPVATIVRVTQTHISISGYIAVYTESRTTVNPTSKTQANPLVGGSLPQQQIAGTRPVWNCSVNGEDMTSLDPAAEGCGATELLGYIYTSAPGGGMPSLPLYRCLSGADHFDSIAANCEGKGSREGLLGYIEARAKLSRYVTPNGDYMSTTVPASFWIGHADWNADGGYLATTQLAGTHPVYECVIAAGDANSEHYTSRDAGCEGSTHALLRAAGYAFDNPIPNVASTPLWRCITAGGEHFDSVSSACESRGKAEVFIGYLQSL